MEFTAGATVTGTSYEEIKPHFIRAYYICFACAANMKSTVLSILNSVVVVKIVLRIFSCWRLAISSRALFTSMDKPLARNNAGAETSTLLSFVAIGSHQATSVLR
eukprot:gb/GECG01013944.1/.p1 GENE.gb/GECG01013944.1/~~gb/GECG01013944.1/.p1  ORF type:complete len:105 (+),score=6.86 gb/GECG01013944.1/:1-315(+)